MPKILTQNLLIALTLALFAQLAAAAEFKTGKHYDAVTPPVATAVADGKIEVVELFWYGCPHCFAFEPVIEEWLKTKADYIEFIRVPAVFARNWEIHARTYYALEQLGMLKASHTTLFDALHRQKKKLGNEDELAAFFAGQGIAEDKFRDAYNSFDVDSKTRRAVTLTRKYGITGVPAVIVAGKYRSSAQKTGTYENLLKLVDFLADKEATH
jgi:thiol:disulfide interchange protein DsbA